jgi:uncharacterized protein
MDALMVVVFISNSCHKECDHCYCRKTAEKMIPQVAEKVGDWIATVCTQENVKNLNVSFLGGEPTNNIEGVFCLADRVNITLSSTRYRSGSLFRASGRIFTNGDFLTREMLLSLKQRKIIIMLNPTYESLDEVENRIRFIKEVCGGCHLSVVLNDFNLLRLEGLTKLAIKYGCHIRVNRLYDGGGNRDYVKAYEIQMTKMFNLLLTADKPMWPNWIMESSYPTWEGVKNPYSCGKWFVVIDPNGDLRSCNPDPSTIVGHISTHKWEDLKFPQRWSAKNLPECQGCEWITWCQGGCPYTRKLTYGNYDHKSPFCEAFKQLFPLLMQLKEKWCERYSDIGLHFDAHAVV